ncbi:MAG: CZB domain-containing protein [Campylobacterota bacterium]|nr:CZB domain-containing protein [Campylobacterota bacterium]
MTREELLDGLVQAKESHLSNMRKINNIIRNRSFINRPPELESTNCGFGHWLHNTEELEKIIGSIFYGDLVTIHKKWHEIYLDMYNSFFENKKLTAILDKIDSSEKEKEIDKLNIKMTKVKFKLSTLDEERIKALYSDLGKVSNQLKTTIDSCERKIHATSYTLFTQPQDDTAAE